MKRATEKERGRTSIERMGEKDKWAGVDRKVQIDVGQMHDGSESVRGGNAV